MSAIKDVFVNVRPAVYGVISELEKCKSVSEIKDLTTELRYWLDGDVLSVVNSLKARLRGTEKPVLSTVNSASSLVKSGDTPKMIIREMETEEEDDMSGGGDSDYNRSVIDFTEVDTLYHSSDVKTNLPPAALFSSTVTPDPTLTATTSVDATATVSASAQECCTATAPPTLSASVQECCTANATATTTVNATEVSTKEEKVLFSTVSPTKPISVSLDISSC